MLIYIFILLHIRNQRLLILHHTVLLAYKIPQSHLTSLALTSLVFNDWVVSDEISVMTVVKAIFLLNMLLREGRV